MSRISSGQAGCNNLTDSNEWYLRTVEPLSVRRGLAAAHRQRSAKERTMEMPVEPRKEVNEDHIRHRAYMLWLEEGEPEGRAEEHWHQALSTADTDDGVPPAKSGKKTK
jgi:hypothetical protein